MYKISIDALRDSCAPHSIGEIMAPTSGGRHVAIYSAQLLASYTFMQQQFGQRRARQLFNAAF
jgi:hypothetical protein